MKTITLKLENDQTVEVYPSDIARVLKGETDGAGLLADIIVNYCNGGRGNAFVALAEKILAAHRHTQATLVRYLLGAVATYSALYEKEWGNLTDPRNAGAVEVAGQVRKEIPWNYFC
jgi:hypothetical protein